MAADGAVVIEVNIDETSFKRGTKELEAHCRRAADGLQGIGEKAQLSILKSVNAFAKQNDAYAKQKQKIRELQAEYDKLANTKVETAPYAAMRGEFDKFSHKLADLEERKERFLATGGKENSTVFRRMEYDAEALSGKLDGLNRKIEGLEQSGQAYTNADTSGIAARLEEAQARLSTMGHTLDEKYASTSLKIRETAAAAQKAATETRSFSEATGKLSENVKASAASFKGGLKSMLKYGFGIRSVFVLFNRLRSALVTGFKNLAQADTRTNQSLSMLTSSLATLKNSLATAFAPILNAVAPALQKLINMLVTASNYVGMFFAAVTGQTTYKKAIAQNIDYAASLNDAADAATSAAEAQDDYLSGLDEIRKFDDGSGSSSAGVGSSGTSGTSGTSPMFEDADVELGTFASSLVLSIQDVLLDWSDLTGEQIAEKIISGLGVLAGGVLGFMIGGVPGAIVGSLAGLALSLVADSLIFDHDGELSGGEIVGAIVTLLGAVAGGLIGFALGGPAGAALGATLGLGLSLALQWFDIIDTDKIFEALQNFKEKFIEWWNNLGLVQWLKDKFHIDITIPVDAEASDEAGDNLSSSLKKAWGALSDSKKTVPLEAYIETGMDELGTAYKRSFSTLKDSRELAFMASIETGTLALGNDYKTLFSTLNDSRSLMFKSDIETDTGTLGDNYRKRFSSNTPDRRTLRFKSDIETSTETIGNDYRARFSNLNVYRTLKFKSAIETSTETIGNDYRARFSDLNVYRTLKFKSAIETSTETIGNDYRARFSNLNVYRTLKFKSAIETSTETIGNDYRARFSNLNVYRTLKFNAAIGTSVSSLWSQFASGWKNKSLSLKVTYSTNVGAVKKAVYKALGLSGWPSIRFAARGGIVDGAALFGSTIVGEAGKEAIIPLEKHTEWLDMVAERLAKLLLQGWLQTSFQGVQDALDRLSDATYRLSGAVSAFRLPAVATGTVIPPRAAYTAPGGEISDTLSSLKDILGALTGAGARNAQSVAEPTYVIQFVQDGKTTFEAVIRQGRVEQRRTGNNPFVSLA